MSELSLNDAVYVNREGGGQLEGVVAFLGSVAFAEGDDWVGVRLTGPSAGSGKNDGSVQSQSYFKCPPNCGLFVRQSAVVVRKLTKIEELRLRRELATSAVSTTTTTKSAAGSGSTTPTSSGRQSRLEELRQRRAAITTATERDTDGGGQPANQEAIDDLTQKLKSKDDALEAMKEKLSTVEKELLDVREKVESYVSENSELKEKLEAKPAILRGGDDSGPSSDQEPPETWTREKQLLEDQVLRFEDKIQTLSKELEKQKAEHSTEVTQLRAESLAYKNELQALSDQAKQKGVADTSHYKEKAALQAQIASLQRNVQDLKREKQELESTLEDLALDKEQIQEENEALMEKLEEIKIDAETAQMEVEELRVELEQTKAAAERAGSSMEMDVAAASLGTGDVASSSTQSDDMAQALSIQNARLREALIRLREQSSVEKMEVTRKLKAAEKEAEAAKDQVKQSTELEILKKKLEEEIRDLKDMVDQGSAFEGMVEDLSDRLMEMEEQNVSLLTTIRELEEAAELTTEMEEVQAEELKAMARDLEDRDTVIRNLEEAIKMQRKREEDFNRTVGNYRTTVETLKKEKEALMELKEGGEGEKTNLLASSQKALARAAQLVSDAAETRKREAQASLDKIEGQAHKHFADRLEKMLPRGVAGMEISATKGELLLSRIVSLVSSSLDGIASSFNNNLRGAPVEEGMVSEMSADESKQGVENMLHQTECAQLLINTSSEAIRYLAAGQWPDLLTEQASMDLGATIGHTMTEVEVVLRAILKSLKEEGVIDTHQSSVDSLRQVAKNAKIELQSELQSNEIIGEALPSDWKPPGLELFNQATNIKFSCLGAASAVAVACKSDSASGPIGAQLRTLLNKLDALNAEATKVCLCLAFLDVKNDDLVSQLSSAAGLVDTSSEKLLSGLRVALLEGGGGNMDDLKSCEEAADLTTKLMSQFASVLRSSKLNSWEDNSYLHPLSPEARDGWDGLSRLARLVRSVDGDDEDINFLMRARSIERRLSEAVNNEPKLSIANSKVATLEKNLASRSKEIAMQNARLSELEKLLAKSSAKPSPVKMSSAVKSSEEFNKLKEENRVLMEAMDVLQEQVAGYENEIRMLNSMKSPKRVGSKPDQRRKALEGATGKRAQSLRNLGAQSGPLVDSVSSSAAVGALEAALFRPALMEARRDAAKWKNTALSQALLELPPLSVPGGSRNFREESKSEECSDSLENLSRLTAAISNFRMEQASIKVVDLDQCKGRSRAHLRASLAAKAAANDELETAVASVKRCLSQYGTVTTLQDSNTQCLLGKVTLQGREPYKSFPASVSRDDLFRMCFHVVR